MVDPRLSAWANYYVIVGSSGAALIGIQFVVITLIASRKGRAPAETIDAFGTPTVVHFASALVLAALMCAPWPSLLALSIAIGLGSLSGIGYGLVVIRRARRQTGYKPVLEDWLWYVTLPCVVHIALGATAVSLRWLPEITLFIVAAAALSLLLIGIHNAWDTVRHLVSTDGGDSVSSVEQTAASK